MMEANETGGRSRMRLLRMVVGLASVAVMSCSVDGAEVGSDELVAWAGFSELAGLTIIGADESRGIDYGISFAASGSVTAIDQALTAAGFDSEFGEPLFETIDGRFGIESDAVADQMWAQDRWKNREDRTVCRDVTRGLVDSGEAVMIVSAYTCA